VLGQLQREHSQLYATHKVTSLPLQPVLGSGFIATHSSLQKSVRPEIFKKSTKRITINKLVAACSRRKMVPRKRMLKAVEDWLCERLWATILKMVLELHLWIKYNHFCCCEHHMARCRHGTGAYFGEYRWRRL